MNRSFMGSPALVVVVVVGLSEIVLEAGAITILFAVTVEVVNEAGKDIADAARRRRTKKDECAEHYAKCMDKALSGEDGNHWRQTRCGACLRKCTRFDAWPTEVGNGSCDYNGWSKQQN